MERLLRAALTRFIRSGNLRITTARGKSFLFGDGTGTPVAVRFTSQSAMYRLLLDPELRLGEAYMDGGLVLDQGSIVDLLAILLTQDRNRKPPFFARPQWLLRYLKRRLAQLNRRQRSRHNVAHHYDLDERLYSLFLGADRQYSCAYFETPDRRWMTPSSPRSGISPPSC